MFNQTNITNYVGQVLDGLFKKIKNKYITIRIESSFFDSQKIYENYTLNASQIDKALEKGGCLKTESLKNLYEYQTLNKKQVDKAIDKEKSTFGPNNHQNTTEQEVYIITELGWLYVCQNLTQQQINKAIEMNKALESLYPNHNLSKENIDKALDKGKFLGWLYSNQALTKEQVDEAIEIGRRLGTLKNHQNLTDKQITIITL